MSGPTKVLIVEARFYQAIADALADGAIGILQEAAVDHERLAVPGAFELPAAIRFAFAAAAGGDPPPFAGCIALGCVVRGETDHYDHICRETSRALMDLAVGHGIPLGFGLLTCGTYEQARVRAAVDGLNKGADAARACLAMIALKRRFAGGR
jgi:6,7-dimethyl-8-ribityllumazine synthase